jgi:hypothetical protein
MMLEELLPTIELLNETIVLDETIVLGDTQEYPMIDDELDKLNDNPAVGFKFCILSNYLFYLIFVSIIISQSHSQLKPKILVWRYFVNLAYTAQVSPATLILPKLVAALT